MGEILFIAHRIPFPPDRGDKIRSFHVLRRLSQLAPVHVACLADGPADMAHEAALAEIATSHCLVPRDRPLALAGLAALALGRPVSLTAFSYPRLHDYVAEIVTQRTISSIFVFSGQMGQYVPAGFSGRVVLDLVDVDSAKFGAYAGCASGVRRWLYTREERLLRGEEARLEARADCTLLVSPEEAALFCSRLPNGRGGAVRSMGMGVDTGWYDPATVTPESALAEPVENEPDGPVLIFTGQMDYPPNVAAATRAVTRIMPAIRAVHPGARCEIVGRQPTAAVLALDGQHGCRVRGAVPDIRPWLRGADLALIPLDIARGVQSKVLEAMAMGLPVIASPGAATGIPAEPGRELAVADDDSAMIAAVLALLAQPDAARAMGAAARAYVIRQHGWPAVLAPLDAALGIVTPEGLPDVA